MKIKIRAKTEKGKLAMQEIFKQSQKFSGKKAGKTIQIESEPYSLVIFPTPLRTYSDSLKPHFKKAIKASTEDMFENNGFDVEINKDYEVE